MAAFQTNTFDAEYAAAFKSVRAAKNILAILVLLSIMVSLAAAISIRYFDVVRLPAPYKAAAVAAPTTTAASRPTSTVAHSPTTVPAGKTSAATTSPSIDRSAEWRYGIDTAISVAELVAPIACLLLAVTLAMTGNLSIVSRCGGTAGFFSAFFWSLILLVILVPWQQLVFSLHTTSVIPAMHELLEQSARMNHGPAVSDVVYYNTRFIAYPIVAFMLWVVVMCKFFTGFRKMNASTAARLPSAARNSPCPTHLKTHRNHEQQYAKRESRNLKFVFYPCRFLRIAIFVFHIHFRLRNNMEDRILRNLKRFVTRTICGLLLTGCLLAGGCQTSEAQERVPYPVSLLLPHKIVVHSFTKTATFKNGAKGLEVYVEAQDAYGDPTKAFGEFRFELYTYRPQNPDPKGRQIASWTESVLDPRTNALHWDISRTYVFDLETEGPLPPGQQFVLLAYFSSPYTERLPAPERVITAGR